MPKLTYDNFDLLIERAAETGQFRAKVVESGGGNPAAIFALSQLPSLWGVADTANARHFSLVSEEEEPALQAVAPDFQRLQEFGGKLFQALFKDDVYLALMSTISRAKKSKRDVRVRLNLSSVPELAVLPWEYLFNTKTSRFLAQSVGTPVVRYLEVTEEIEDLQATAPLRVLVMIAKPAGLATLDTEAEWQKLKRAVAELERQGLLQLERLERATVEALQERLLERRDQDPYHIFHFIGHGSFNPQTQCGELILEDEEGQAAPLTGQDLGGLLHDHSALRLAFINACEGAKTSVQDSYGGVAQCLLRTGGIPAVIAMQFEISDPAAVFFADKFYEKLATGWPVDAALAQVRGLLSAKGHSVEWATPVLYLRSPNGEIFPGLADARPILAPAQPDAPLSSGNGKPSAPEFRLPQFEEHYRAVVTALLEGQLVPFLGLDSNLFARTPDEGWKPGATLPSSSELTRYLAQQAKYPAEAILSLTAVSQYYSASDRTLELYDELDKIYRPQGGQPNFQPNPLHNFLATLPALLKQANYPRSSDELRQRFLVVTTNYDNLLECAFQQHLRDFHVVTYLVEGEQRGRFQHWQPATGQTTLLGENPNDYRGLADTRPIILKLPGTLNYQGGVHSIAITEDHYAEYLTYRDLNALLPGQVTGKLQRSHHLFLGFGLREWNLRALLYRAWKGRKPGSPSWAISPQMPPSEQQFWRACGVEPLTASLADYLADLEQHVRARLTIGGEV